MIKTRFWPPSNTGEGLERGKHIAKSRVNEEHEDPKILAIKAGKHRFTVFFTPALTSGSYATITRNKKQKLDKIGKGVSPTNDRAMDDYVRRTQRGEYYERN